MSIFKTLFGKKSESASQTDDFILTKVVHKFINGTEYVFQHVNFKGKPLGLVGAVSTLDSALVTYDSCRPISEDSNFNVSYRLSTPEYFEDLVEVARFLNKKDLVNTKSSIETLEYMCTKHIKKFNRIIDTDIYVYIDLVIVFIRLFLETSNQQISDEELEHLWIHMLDYSKHNFEEFIFLTRYDFSKPPEQQPYLVKYKS